MTRARARWTTALAVAVPLIVVGCGSSGKKASTSATDTGATSSTASATTAAGGGYGGSTATTTAAGGTTSGATVSVADVPKVGKVLVAADGRTLYLYEKDQGMKAACTGGCLSAWPAYTSATPPKAGDGVTASKLSVAMGAVANQVVYNGHLLYEFGGDKKAGDANGVGAPSWYPVTPAGTSSE